MAFTLVGPSGFAIEFFLISPLRTELTLTGGTLALAIAFLSGVSMIFLPCGYPLLFTLTPLAARSAQRPWLRSLSFFALGIGGAMAGVGAMVAVLGGSFLDTLLVASPTARVPVAVGVYGGLGLLSIILASQSLGLLRLRIPGFADLVQYLLGRVAKADGAGRRMLAFGALYGGGMSAGCPVPVYWALLFWAAVSANPGFGAVLLGLHGLGYALPLFPVGWLARAGATRWLARAVREHGYTVESLVAAGLLTLGIFLVLVFGVSLPLRVFVFPF